jgi:hypothetical protein
VVAQTVRLGKSLKIPWKLQNDPEMDLCDQARVNILLAITVTLKEYPHAENLVQECLELCDQLDEDGVVEDHEDYAKLERMICQSKKTLLAVQAHKAALLFRMQLLADEDTDADGYDDDEDDLANMDEDVLDTSTSSGESFDCCSILKGKWWRYRG